MIILNRKELEHYKKNFVLKTEKEKKKFNRKKII